MFVTRSARRRRASPAACWPSSRASLATPARPASAAHDRAAAGGDRALSQDRLRDRLQPHRGRPHGLLDGEGALAASVSVVAEQLCTANGVELCYETFGDPADPALLLIMGLGTQMIGWHEDFCEQLAGRGFHVIRFDNRDIGRSTHDRDGPAPTPRQLLRRDKSAARYTLDRHGRRRHRPARPPRDRARARRRRLDGRHDRPAMAAPAPGPRALARARSCPTPAPLVRPAGAQRCTRVLLKPPPRDRDGDDRARRERVHADRLARLRARRATSCATIAERSYDRGHDPPARARQLAAIIASRRPHRRLLRRIDVPTVVIHGTKDKLVRRPAAARRREAIPGARLVVIDGMGHDLPRGAWPRIIDAIVENAARAGEPAAA